MNPFSITIEDVRAYLGLEAIGSPATHPSDAQLEALLASAIATLRRLTGRNLTYGVYRDTFQHIEQRIYLRETPVEALISITDTKTLMNPDNYRFFKSKGFLHFDNAWYARGYSRFGYASSAYLDVVYVGGYLVLPADMVLAVLSGVQAQYNYTQQVASYGGQVKRISVYDVGVTDIATPKEVSTSVMLDTMTSQLASYSAYDQPGLAGWKLAESEYLGTYGGSPDLLPPGTPVYLG